MGEQAVVIWRYHLRADPNLCWGSSLRFKMQKAQGDTRRSLKNHHRIPAPKRHQASPKINPRSFSASLPPNLATHPQKMVPPGGFASPPRPPRSQSAVSAAGRCVASAPHPPPRAAASRPAPAGSPSSAGRIPPPRCSRCLTHPAVDPDPKDPGVPAAVPTARTLDFCQIPKILKIFQMDSWKGLAKCRALKTERYPLVISRGSMKTQCFLVGASM